MNKNQLLRYIEDTINYMVKYDKFVVYSYDKSQQIIYSGKPYGLFGYGFDLKNNKDFSKFKVFKLIK